MPAVPCPSCQAPLPAGGASECPACHLPLTGPVAARLWEVDQSLATLTRERASLLTTLRQGPAAALTPEAGARTGRPAGPDRAAPARTRAPAALERAAGAPGRGRAAGARGGAGLHRRRVGPDRRPRAGAGHGSPDRRHRLRRHAPVPAPPAQQRGGHGNADRRAAPARPLCGPVAGPRQPRGRRPAHLHGAHRARRGCCPGRAARRRHPDPRLRRRLAARGICLMGSRARLGRRDDRGARRRGAGGRGGLRLRQAAAPPTWPGALGRGGARCLLAARLAGERPDRRLRGGSHRRRADRFGGRGDRRPGGHRRRRVRPDPSGARPPPQRSPPPRAPRSAPSGAPRRSSPGGCRSAPWPPR